MREPSAATRTCEAKIIKLPLFPPHETLSWKMKSIGGTAYSLPYISSDHGLMLDQLVPTTFNAETFGVLMILVALEAVLSADNAIALAAIAQGLESEKLQRRALNLGLLFAYVLRILLIVTASWVIQFWQFELLGAAYLLWLVFNYFTSPEEKKQVHHGLAFASVWQAIPMIALTDFAFSLDSVTAAIAVADETWLIVVGGTIGVITLRFLAGLFIRLLKQYTHLEDAGFITVGLVGIRLLFRVVNPEWNLPEWFMTASIVAIFIWGFSERTSQPVEEE